MEWETFLQFVILSMEEFKKTAANNLVKLAMGMEVVDEICEIKYTINEKGEDIAVEKKVRTTKRTLPPDLNAILQLLDKKPQLAKDLNDKDTQVREIDYKILPKAQLRKLANVE